MRNTNIDRRYGQRHLHDEVVAAVWHGRDHHAIAMQYGVDLRSVRRIWETLLSEPGRLHMQADDDVETLTDAIVADTGIHETDAADIALRTLLRWYANGRTVRLPDYAQIRMMATAWAKSRMEQGVDADHDE